MVRPTATTLEKDDVASDISMSSYVESLSDGVLWLRPGVRRTVPLQVFQELFRDYDIVCRAVRDCTIEHKTESGKESLSYSAGDAIAATSADREDLLYKELDQRGVEEGAVTMEPGANWRRGKGPGREH